MKRSRFTESQIVAVLKEGEAGMPIAEIVRKHGISRGTYFAWRSKYSGVSVSELKKMKDLEAENAPSSDRIVIAAVVVVRRGVFRSEHSYGLRLFHVHAIALAA